MELSLFGLTPKNAPQVRKSLFTEIHDIVFHGNGGYDWNTVYNMPIWLRKYTFNQIDRFNKNRNKELEQGKDPNKKVIVPSFLKGKTSYK